MSRHLCAPNNQAWARDQASPSAATVTAAAPSKRPPSPLLFYCFHPFYCLGTRPAAEGIAKIRVRLSSGNDCEFSPPPAVWNLTSGERIAVRNAATAAAAAAIAAAGLRHRISLKGTKAGKFQSQIWPRDELWSRPSKVSP